MRPPSLRDLLADPPPDDDPGRAAARADWARIREAIEGLAGLPPDEADRRIEALRASPDPVHRRAADLASRREQAQGFLEPPAHRPHVDGPPPPPEYSRGQLVGRYRIESVIGEGGMGRVYLATDTQLLRPVALKVFTTSRIRGATPLREARMAAQLHHANIATVHDVLDADGRLHIVMEYLRGRPLSAVLDHDRLELDRIAAITAKVLAAVDHAHREGVIHCDLKPANVFVLDDGDIKVLDFGLARQDARPLHGDSSMAVAGTPRYMAPERVLGAHPDARTDIYSLGVMLEEMLRVAAPVASTPSSSAITVAPKPDLERRRARLHEVAARASAHDPAQRYPSVAEMARPLDAVRDGGGLDGTPRRSAKWAVAGGGLAAATALLVALVGTAPETSDEPRSVAVRLSAPGTDAAASYVAAAMQQVLEHSLANIRGLTVVRPPAPTGDNEDLGATHLLSGNVERTGEDVEVLLSISGRDGAVLASQRVSSELKDLSALAVSLATGAETVLARSGMRVVRSTPADAAVSIVASIDSVAFEEYAQAREYMGSPDLPNYLDHAITQLGRAVARAPGFGLAYAGLAEAYWQKYQATRDATWTDRARAAALDALRLTPDDPIVRYTLALIYRGMGRREEALTEVTKAIALQPANDDFFRLRGRLHAGFGGSIARLPISRRREASAPATGTTTMPSG